VAKRRPFAASIGFPPGGTHAAQRARIGCHTFRATGITAYLEAGGTLENAQAMAAHESPRTTKLYDRTGSEITLEEVERIAI
jgi:integrase